MIETKAFKKFQLRTGGKLIYGKAKNSKYTPVFDYIIFSVMEASKKCGHNNWTAAQDAQIVLRREGFSFYKNWTPYVNNILQRHYEIKKAIKTTEEERKSKVTEKWLRLR